MNTEQRRGHMRMIDKGYETRINTVSLHRCSALYLTKTHKSLSCYTVVTSHEPNAHSYCLTRLFSTRRLSLAPIRRPLPLRDSSYQKSALNFCLRDAPTQDVHSVVLQETTRSFPVLLPPPGDLGSGIPGSCASEVEVRVELDFPLSAQLHAHR